MCIATDNLQNPFLEVRVQIWYRLASNAEDLTSFLSYRLDSNPSYFDLFAIPESLWHALIRTHHITSRKKVAKLKQAAATHHVYVLVRSGSSPGIMYVEGPQAGVESWVAAVQVRLSASAGFLAYLEFRSAVWLTVGLLV